MIKDIKEAVQSYNRVQQWLKYIMQRQSPQNNNREKLRQKLILSPQQQSDQRKFHDYVFLTSSLLSDLIEDQDSQQQGDNHFDSSILKNIDIKTYIQSIHNQTKFEPECLILALIYIDRYNLNSSQFTLTQTNIHKLLLACLLLATKFHDEVYYDNKAFEMGGGVNNVKLVELETKVFERLGFDLFVEDTYFFEFLDSLYNAYLPKKQRKSGSETENVDEDG